MENQKLTKAFATNALISKDNLGFLFVVPYFQVAKLGNLNIIAQNTCKTYDAVVSTDGVNRSFNDELTIAINEIISKINKDNSEYKREKDKLLWFCDELPKFIQKIHNIAYLIFPSYGKETNILGDLNSCLPCKFKSFAFPFSGYNDRDEDNLLKDEENLNVAKLYGLKKIDFKNGSELVSWLPTTKLDQFCNSLKELLKKVGYNFDETSDGRKYYVAYLVQSFMNVIFAENPYLPLQQINKIVDNYKKFVNDVFNGKKDLFDDLEKLQDEKNNNEDKIGSNQDYNFVRFLFKKIYTDTSFKDIAAQDEKKCLEAIIEIANLLCNALHANQMLVFKKLNADIATFSDGVELKNNFLYVPFYKIIQNCSELENFLGNESNKLKKILTFMINLAGKLRHEKVSSDLSKTEDVNNKDKFGWQISHNGTSYKKPVNYDTDIDPKKLINLTKEIIDFEEYIKENSLDLDNLIKYLLDGRYFGCIDDIDDSGVECIKKIIENKDLMEKFIKQVNNASENDKVKRAYKIFLNDYFDSIESNDFIKIEYLEDENLVKFFSRPGNNKKIMDLEPVDILKLDLVSKLDVDIINNFLVGNDDEKRKINEVLELCINCLDIEKLSKLNFGNLDPKIAESIILFKIEILSDAIVKKINFKELSIEAQVKLLNWMAQTKSKFSSFTEEHLKQISCDVFIDKSITFQLICNFSQFLSNNKSWKFTRYDILNKLPLDFLIVYELIKCGTNYAYFKNFLINCVDLNDYFKYTNKELSNEQMSKKQILLIGSEILGTKNFLLSDETEKFICKLINNFYNVNKSDNNKSYIQDVHNIFGDFRDKDIKPIIEYIFGDCKHFRLCVFIILEFIISDDVMNDDLQQIQNNIKDALGWSKKESRERIIKGFFSCIDDINKFISCFGDYQGITKLYISFLNNLISKHIDDIDKGDFCKIQFYYLESKNITALCDKSPQSIRESNFSSLKDDFNSSSGYEKLKLILSKIVPVVDIYKKNQEAYNNELDNIDLDYCTEIEVQAGMISSGNNFDLEKYNNEGKFNEDSPMYLIFKDFIGKKLTVLENDLDTTELENVLEKKDYSKFVNMFLPVIKRDWGNMSFRDFAIKYKLLEQICISNVDATNIINFYADFQEGKLQDFIKKYCLNCDLLKGKDSDKEKIAAACCDYKSLENEEKKWLEEINKKLKDNEKLEPNDKDICCSICYDQISQLDCIKNNNFVPKIIDFLRTNTQFIFLRTNTQFIGNSLQTITSDKNWIDFIGKSLQTITSDNNWKNFIDKNFQNQREQAEKYLREVKDIIDRFYLIVTSVISQYKSKINNTHWVEKILSIQENGDIYKKLSSIYSDYKLKQESNWIDFSERHILKYIYTDRIKKYRQYKKMEEQCKSLEANKSYLENLLKTFCSELKIKCDHLIDHDNDRIKSKLLYIFRELEDKKVKLLQKWNFKLSYPECPKPTQENGLCEVFAYGTMDRMAKLNPSLSKEFQNRYGIFSHYDEEAGYERSYMPDISNLSSKALIQLAEDAKILKKFVYVQSGRGLLTVWIKSVERYMFKPGIESFIKLLVQYSKLTFATYSKKQNNGQHLSEDNFQKLQNDLKQLHEKYSKYENQFLHLNDLFEIKNDFENDFKKAKEIINDMQLSDKNEKKNLKEMEEEIEKCMNLALNVDDINLDCANYKSILPLEKFLEVAYENNFFSDEQILDTGIINFYDVNLLQEEGKEKKGVLYTPNFIIKRLGLMINHNSTITSGFNDAEARVIKNLHIRPTDGNYLEDFVNLHISNHDTLFRIMEKIFYYRFQNINNDCYDYDEAAKRDYKLSLDDTTNSKKVNLRIFLRTRLLELLGYSTSAYKIKTNNSQKLKQYKDMLEGNYADIYSFLLADFSFVGLIKKFSKDEYKSQNITKAFNNLIDNVRERLLSLLNCFSEKDRKLNEQILEEIKKQNTLVLDLNELIARGILRSASKLFDELSNNNQQTIFNIILSMLARCSSVDEYKNKQFNNIKEMKEWIQSSSIRYFVPLRLPDNPLSNYSSVFEHMFTYIANKLKSQIDWLEKLYLNFSEYESENDKIYKANIADHTVMIWLEDVVNSNNAGRALPIILKFLNENNSSIGTLMDWNTSSTAIDFFRKAGIIDGSKKFTNQQSVKMWFEFMWGLNNIRNINHQKKYNKLIDTFYTQIDFRFVSESDVIDLLNSSLPNLFPQTPYGVFLDFHGFADKILERVFTKNSDILADNNFVIKFIKFLFDTGCVIKDRGSNTLDTEKCIGLLDKILIVRPGCAKKDFNRFGLIYSTLLENVKPNTEHMQNHLKNLKRKYAYHMLYMANSLKEMTQILQFIKSSNEGLFPIIRYTDIDPQFKYVLCKIWDNLGNIRANGKADMEANIDENTFILFMDFFKSIQLESEDEIDAKKFSIAKFIGWLCPLEFANAVTLEEYIKLIKEKCFSSCSSVNESIVKFVLQVLFFSKGQDRTENLSIFDVMFLLCEYGSIYDLYGVEDYNTKTDNIFNVVKHFLEKWLGRIQKELKDDNDSLIKLADQKNKFDILIQTVLYSSSNLVNKKQDFSCMKTLLSCLSMIKNITKINNDNNLERYYKEIWSPIFASNFVCVDKSQVGVCRKIMLDHLLCGQENEVSVPEILNFVIKKFPANNIEIEENKKILIDSELREKILGFYIKEDDPTVALRGCKLLKALFKSNCFGKDIETSLIKTLIIKSFNSNKIKAAENVNTFMKDLTNSLDELAGDSEFDNKVVLKKLFSLKANEVKVYQMLIFIAKSKAYGKDLLDGIRIQFTENDITILGADNNSLLTEPIDNDLKNIETLCDLLFTISESGCVIDCDQLVSQLDDGCINDIKYFRIMAKHCNDIKILRTKINSQLINDSFGCITEVTRKRFTLPRDNNGKIDCGEFFDLLTGGFVSPKDDSKNIEFGNMEYNIETYINKFDSVLVDKSDEYLSVCVSQFAINLNNIGTKISNNDSTLLWFITMYLLISLHMYKEELLEQSNKSIKDLVASIFNKNENGEIYSKICKLNKANQYIFNTAFTHAIKIFLIGKIKAEIDFYNNSTWIKFSINTNSFFITDKVGKFGIELTNDDDELIKKYLDSYTGEDKENIKCRLEQSSKNRKEKSKEKENLNIFELFKRGEINSQNSIPTKRKYSCNIGSKNYNMIDKDEKSNDSQDTDNSFDNDNNEKENGYINNIFINEEKNKETDEERKTDNDFSNDSPSLDNNSEKRIETEQQNKFNFLWAKIIIGLFILAAAVLLLFVGFVIFGAIAFCISMYQIFTGLKFGSSNEKPRSDNLINSPLNNQIEDKNSLLDMDTNIINQDKENSQML